MRAFQIFLVTIALVAVAVVGWALGSRGGHGRPGTGPVASGGLSTPARHDSGGQGKVSRDDDKPSGNTEPTGRPASRPEIRGIWTVPATLHIGQALHLPPGPARVTFRFEITNATRAQFWRAHGATVDKTAIWLGEDSHPPNGWSVGMRYGDEGFTGNLIIRATGPGGTTEEFVGVTDNGGM